MKNIMCKDVMELLPLYIDKELSEAELGSVREHLTACLDCRQELAFLEGILQTAQNMPEIEVTEAFRQNLHDKLVSVNAQMVAERKRKSFLTLLKGWKTYSTVAVSAAIIALCVVALPKLPGVNKQLTDEFQSNQTSQPSVTTNNNNDVKLQIPSSTAKDNATANPTQPAATNSVQENTTNDAGNQPAEYNDNKEAAYNTENVPNDSFAQVPVTYPTPQPTKEPTAQIQQDHSAESFSIASMVPEKNAALSITEEPPSSKSPASINGGGGSANDHSGSSMKMFRFISKVQFIFQLEYDNVGLQDAKNVLAKYQQGDAYHIPSADYNNLAETLTKIDGYVSLTDLSIDKTTEYNKLSSELEQIENQLSENDSDSDSLNEQKQSIQQQLVQIDKETQDYIIYLK